jgi:hypothetical protein
VIEHNPVQVIIQGDLANFINVENEIVQHFHFFVIQSKYAGGLLAGLVPPSVV